ncbi:uracil-DNA glycosylase [Candidozyma auris]|nr:uracil-DNA glycosylase [[Candida] auris]
MNNTTVKKSIEKIETVERSISPEIPTRDASRSVKDEKIQEIGSDYADFCHEVNFNKDEWLQTLNEEQRRLLDLEIRTLHITWLAVLHKELTKPYFIKLKKFLQVQMATKTVFPTPKDIYSWSHLTPLPELKCLILGQDPYHNHNQAHGLAFSVLEPTRPPPSLLNIYKTLKIDFPSFQIPDYKELAKQGKPGGGNLSKWAKRGV